MLGVRPAAWAPLLLLLLLGVGTSAHATAQDDVSALCELYAAAGGTGWTNKDGWKTCVSGGTTATSDPCGTSPAWHGVTCDTTAQPSRVTRL